MKRSLFSLIPLVACSSQSGTGMIDAGNPGGAGLPLSIVSDVPLPGGSTRFDYQDTDVALGHLVIAHMNANAVLIVDLKDGSTLKQLTNIPVARGHVGTEWDA
jgi:hypothetical protein